MSEHVDVHHRIEFGRRTRRAYASTLASTTRIECLGEPMSGTSMAAPHVAGIVALLLQRDPKLTGEQVRKILIASTDPVTGAANFDPAWGFGRVDALAAIKLI